jgi:very-short-patch-repair endonuclease
LIIAADVAQFLYHRCGEIVGRLSIGLRAIVGPFVNGNARDPGQVLATILKIPNALIMEAGEGNLTARCAWLCNERMDHQGPVAAARIGTRDYARRLRQTETEAECKLWRALRDRQIEGAKFRRQRPVGRFVADFACVEVRLIVEVDGGQHDGATGDAARTAVLMAQGWSVVRFWSNEVLENLAGVLVRIADAVRGRRGPSPSQR